MLIRNAEIAAKVKEDEANRVKEAEVEEGNVEIPDMGDDSY